MPKSDKSTNQAHPYLLPDQNQVLWYPPALVFKNDTKNLFH